MVSCSVIGVEIWKMRGVEGRWVGQIRKQGYGVSRIWFDGIRCPGCGVLREGVLMASVEYSEYFGAGKAHPSFGRLGDAQ